MVKAILIAFSGLLIFTKVAFASDPPILTSPSNNSTVTSSALNWQAPNYQLFSSNPYRIQVNSDPSFTPISSIYRDTYKDTTNYTPTLTPGLWYWRVEAKDSTGTWSNWSDTWSFTLTTATPTPSSSATPSPTTSSQFSISNVPSSIDSTTDFYVNVNLSLPSSPNTKFFLKGAFKKPDGNNYFGQTKVGSAFVNNGASFDSQLVATTDASGNWSGSIDIQIDPNDSGYTGTGDYTFKVGRYTTSGSGPTWSNETTLTINAKEVSAQNDSSVTNLASLAKKSSEPISDSVEGISTSSGDLPDVVYSLENYLKTSTDSATPSATTEVKLKNEKSFNIFPYIGGLFLIIGLGLLSFIFLKKRLKFKL